MILTSGWAGVARALSEERRFADFAIDNWTVADGLPQVAVQALQQDADGYVWVGTQAAVARFDGVRFERFDRERTGGVETSMADGSFRASDGHVWFATRDGALRLRGEDVRYFSAAGTPVRVRAIAEWPAGRMLFGTPLGLYRLHGDALVPTELTGTDVTALLADRGGLWIGSGSRLLRREGDQTRAFTLEGPADLAITDFVARGDTLWIATNRGLWRRSGDAAPQPFAPEGTGLRSTPIEALCADRGGSVWASTMARLYRLRSDGAVEAVADEALARSPWINACFEDREGNLWLGSHTESLFRIWDGLVSRIGAADGLVDPFVWSIEADGNGGVLLGSNSGLVRWRAGTIEPLVAGSALPNPAVYELAKIADDRLWIGTRGGLRERRGGRIIPVAGGEALEGAQINAIVVEPDGTRWVGSSLGLFSARDEDPLRPVAAGALSGTAGRVRSVLPLGGGAVLIGTEQGVRLVDGDSVTVPDWAAGIEGRMITSLLDLPDGRRVIGTLDSGLVLVADSRALPLDGGDALPTLNAWHLHLADDTLFVTSTEGVYRVALEDLPDPRDGPSTMLPGRADWVISMAGRNQSGQRARCCNGGARSRALRIGDELWLPSISGVLRLDLDAIGKDLVMPLVHVESIWNGGRRWSPDAGPLRLANGERDLRIDYTALSFRNPRALTFDYRLDGFDADWVPAADRRSAFYTNLPAGRYRFRVRARDAFGQAVQSADRVEIIIEPVWSERPVVRIALVAAGLMCVALGVIVAMRRQRQRTSRLEELIDDRTRQLQRANERLEQANAALAVESQTDALTGLPNRRAVFQQMPAMLARHPDGVVLALVDIDHFKQVNDDYGHATGDLVLRDFAAFLRRATREGDLLARWGGEEFLVVFGGLREDAVPARIQRLIDDGRAMHYDLGKERPLHLTFSVGWTQRPPGAVAPADWVAALELADAALYQAKAHGRDTWVGLVSGPQAWDGETHGHPGKRIDELVGEGRLQWLNLKPKLATVGGRMRTG